MNTIALLILILFILMYLVGDKRGIKSFFTLCFNFIIFFVMIEFISFNVQPILITVISCILISSVTLFYINGFNIKTMSALISVTIVVLLTILLTYKMGLYANIQGFGSEQLEEISGAALSLDVSLSFPKIVVCVLLIGLLGAIVDVSISISSSMNEIYKQNPAIAKKDLLTSGINIGKDILGTMTNTLLFAYVSGFLTLIIYYVEIKLTLSELLNKKVFVSDVFQILSSGIGIILIIPVTAFISVTLMYYYKKQQITP